jgi:hypothetical protein
MAGVRLRRLPAVLTFCLLRFDFDMKTGQVRFLPLAVPEPLRVL